ncbi:uncharacterized protein LOC117581007 isoform X2 [Drosophila guanche]|uniref:Uncharacterized protein n=1 Tax=Drosophila guanche TaxID=7266 RepID=A0A3B0JZW7_DROGU|nr:uncharacterized protein LOC117581007 isoform X2 [Drosophila guanche]SPP78291.1 Hypothetical predicted protein [Drosophila guanche]
MESPDQNPYASLLPHIVDMLHGKPRQSATLDQVCAGVESLAQLNEALMQHISCFDSLQAAVQFGIGLGVSMGILTNSKDTLRLGSKLHVRSTDNQQSTLGVEVEHKDLRTRVHKFEEPLHNELLQELMFSDEAGRQAYSVDGPLIPGRTLRSAMKRVPGAETNQSTADDV